MIPVEGEPLSRILARQRGVPVGTLVRLLGEILDEVGAAHRKGLGYRHLRADHVVVTPSGHARLVDDPDHHDPDARGDVYAIGAMLYQGIAGVPPAGTDTVALQRRRAAASSGGDLPAALDAVIERALAARPEERFESAAQMAVALRAAAAALPEEAFAPLVVEVAAAAPAETVTTGRDDLPIQTALERKAPATPRPAAPEQFEEYRVVRVLGRGAMGEVFLAHDALLDRLVAIKFIAHRPDVGSRARFLVEARAAARLHHPNVVTVFRVGELDGRPFIVSEFVRGVPLDKVAKPVPSEQVIALALGLARGLAAAHRHGVLHRDIKPANTILRDDGAPVLVDFGLAKLVGAEETPPAATAASEAPPPEQATMTVEPDPLGRTDHDADVLRAAADAIPFRVAPESPVLGGDLVVTRAGAVMGTPYYMAPEIWRGEPATTRSDVYSLGACLYELATGAAPHRGVAGVQLAMVVNEVDAVPLASRAPGLSPELAALVDRCLARDPLARPASADEVRQALELLAAPRSAAPLPPGNPYRGLLAFEAEHRALFFGREADIAAVLDRLRSLPLVLVAGDSGVGKSSLVRAGVIPLVEERGLGGERRFRTHVIRPGRAPLAALAALLPEATQDAESQLREDPGAIATHLRRHLPAGEGMLVVLDQLEELVTLAPPADAAAAAECIAALAGGHPGIRVLATARADHIGRLAALPELGALVAGSLYLVRPLGRDAIRTTIVGPARATGVRFEPDALVDEITDAVADAGAALPLLQFALAELWQARDVDGNRITAATLARVGGIAGALTQHADRVIAALPPGSRRAARGILLRLIKDGGVRATRTAAELGDEPEIRTAIAALIEGRLLVAREAGGETTYEIAHEALLTSWDTLRQWLDDEAGTRAVRERLGAAAAEWDRLGRDRDALWSDAQLAGVRGLDLELLSGRERAFVAASATALRRRRWRNRALAVAVVLFVIVVWAGFRWSARRDRGRAVDAHLATGRRALELASETFADADQRREAAHATFRRGELEAGEEVWSEVKQLEGDADVALARASLAFEEALRLDPDRQEARASLAGALYQRALLAESHQNRVARDELLDRLATYDDTSAFRNRWRERATISIVATPAARVTLERYVEAADGSRHLERVGDLGTTPLDDVKLEPGGIL